ncbi:MAG: helix-turn-helix transcriptional regulator [Bacteroidales bacterium]|nr:helix-turn-helix transcriptional regulator [Bacteroidales bacterium]
MRNRAQLSQTAFAEIFNLKRAAVGAYEEERAEPKVEVFVQIARHFGIPVEDLICRNLQKEECAPQAGISGIRLVRQGRMAEFAQSQMRGDAFAGYEYLHIPVAESGLLALEYQGSILIVRPQDGSGEQSANTLILGLGGIELAAASAIGQGIRQYEVLYIIKRFDAQDRTEAMLGAIARKLDAMQRPSI